MILLEKTGIVTPKDDKTNIFFDFAVPSGIKKIVIDYNYSPKTVENKADLVLSNRCILNPSAQPLPTRFKQ